MFVKANVNHAVYSERGAVITDRDFGAQETKSEASNRSTSLAVRVPDGLQRKLPTLPVRLTQFLIFPYAHPRVLGYNCEIHL